MNAFTEQEQEYNLGKEEEKEKYSAVKQEVQLE